MKLISMHVDNFGGLHNYDFHFDEGLNVVLQENGWGKTTMAAFLKAMLYGFDAKRSKDITENERKRYLPWQGGTFGGSLDFEAEGVHYRIYRTFGETPRFDKVKIVDVDKKVTAKIDPAKIGETLFRLDASAFQRSVFINQNGLSIDGAASSIHTRLNALVSQANDVAAYDDAIANLTAQIKMYEKTGARGQIGDITRQLSALEQQRDQLEADLAAQDAARERITQIDILLSSVNEELEKKKARLDVVSGEAKKREASQKLLNDINKQIADLQSRIDTVKAGLGGGIPTQAEMDAVQHQKQVMTALAAQLAELKADHEKLTADYQALLVSYNGTLPTASQLDEIQRIYSELQGILSTGTEDTKPTGSLPEGYTLISAALETDPDYLRKLETTVAAQTALQQLTRDLEAREQDIRRESDSWTEKTKRYAELHTEVQFHQTEIRKQEQYTPVRVSPVISGLVELQKKERTLTRRKAELESAIVRETADWVSRKKQYALLKKEEAALRQEAAASECYSTSKVQPVIEALEEIQRMQQTVSVKQEALRRTELTAQQEVLLAANPDALPDPVEGSEILKKYRSVAAHQAEIQGLAARLEGEKSKSISLKASIDQLDIYTPGPAVAPEEPKKPESVAMIGIGAALTLVGILLGIVASPAMAAIAAAGVLLVILGIVQSSRYKARCQAYEAYKAAAFQRQEIGRKRADYQQQLKVAQSCIIELETQIAQQTRQMEAAQEAVSAWMTAWAAGAEPSEGAISEILDKAEEIKQLRKRMMDFMEIRAAVEAQKEDIARRREFVNSQCPELSEKSEAEALQILRLGETDYKIKSDKRNTAIRNLKKFLADIGISEAQFEAEESPHKNSLQTELGEILSAIAGLESQRTDLDAHFPEIARKSYDDALAYLREKQSTYMVSDSRLQTALQSERKFVSKAKVSADQLLLKQSPDLAKLTEARNGAAAALAHALAKANSVLSRIGITVTAENAQAQLRKAEQLSNSYNQYAEKLREHAERRQKKQQQIRELQSKLEAKLPALQGRYADLELPERLSRIREAVTNAAKLREKIAETEAEQRRQNTRRKAASDAVESFLTSYSRSAAGSGDALAEIAEKAGLYAELSAAIRQLEKQRASIQTDHSTQVHPASAEETELKAWIAHAEARRDNLLVEYTQKSDFIRQADQSLEKYPDIATQLRQLYDQKQKAQNTLIMLKRAAQLITRAKENLANRYLGKVEQRFNSYMHIWLNSDAVRGILDIDFNITIEENEKIHVAEGYSTGYCDLIDFCMRLALVDTLFENEQPFLILDDPFVNLDAQRLEKALELLSVMAATRQIVYFVCHPIRAVETEEDSSSRAEFVRLAEAARKNLAGQARIGGRQQKPLHRSVKELYKVVSDGTPLPFYPAKPGYTITNNIFSLTFVMAEGAAPKDHSYELFFIDAKGHVLNDRQLLEVRNGKLSAERVQFCLNTRDDSGDQYELMIRASGQDDYEVAMRIPFKAKLAFTGTDSFDF